MTSYLRGIHAEARSQWLETLSKNKTRIINKQTMAERRSIVEDLAGTISGIGQVTIDNTVAMIEEYIGRGMPEELDPFGCIFETDDNSDV